MKVRIRYDNKILAEDVLIADDMYSRLVGLMFKNAPPQGAQGLLLDPCNSIHTFFMRYPLDVAFLSSGNTVVKIVRNLKPWRMTWIYFSARKTLELPAGKMPMDLRVGQKLEVEHV